MRISDWSSDVCSSDLTEELWRWRYARDHRIRYRQLLDPVGMIGCHGKTDPHADIVPRHAKSLVAKGIHHRDQFVTDRRDIVIAARVVGSDDEIGRAHV